MTAKPGALDPIASVPKSTKSKIFWFLFGGFSFASGLVTATLGGLYLGVLPTEFAELVKQAQSTVKMNIESAVLAARDSGQLSTSLFTSDRTYPQHMLNPSPLVINFNSPYDFKIFGAQNEDFADADAEEIEPINIGQTPNFDREFVLNDGQHRIGREFAISAGLRDRVGFWFDVYSKYDSNKRIIHHSRYPWIVYKVVDVAPIINSDSPRHRWMRNEKADKLVKSEQQKIRAALNSVAHRANLNHLNSYEQIVVGALSKLKGTPKKLASEAAGNLRVQVGQRDFFQSGLEVSPRYLIGMEEIFKRYGLPPELTRIPFVESSFNKQATSKVGACGVWQFMGSTGRKFMIVTDHIDERRSPYKATEAAARLLKENHLILHRSWPLAITAWNHGPPGLRKGIAIAHSQDLALIISRYHSKSFDFASSNFYTEFLGALYTEKYNQEIFGDLDRSEALDARPVRLAKSIRGKELLHKSGLKVDQFELLNPDLQRAIQTNSPIPVGFRLMITDEAREELGAIVAKPTKANAKEKMFAALTPNPEAQRIQ